MKFKIVFLLLLFLMLIPSFVLSNDFKKKEYNIDFLWSFIAVSNQKTIPIQKEAYLKTGDRLKMYLELESDFYVYIIYIDSKNQLHRLFPYPFHTLSHKYNKHEKYYIPRDEYWFQLNNVIGTEKFYLLASWKRLEKIEDLLSAYEENVIDEKKNKIIDMLLSKIINLRKQHRNLSTKAERPIIIGGKVRGSTQNEIVDQQNIFEDLLQIQAETFFCKVFTIDHTSD